MIRVSCDFKGVASQSKSPPYPTKFDVDRHSVRENIQGFVCNVIQQDHMFKGSCDFMDEIS